MKTETVLDNSWFLNDFFDTNGVKLSDIEWVSLQGRTDKCGYPLSIYCNAAIQRSLEWVKALSVEEGQKALDAGLVCVLGTVKYHQFPNSSGYETQHTRTSFGSRVSLNAADYNEVWYIPRKEWEAAPKVAERFVKMNREWAQNAPKKVTLNGEEYECIQNWHVTERQYRERLKAQKVG